MSRLASTSPSGPKGEQPESSVAARRQSWTLPVQELEDLRAARRRSRHLQDENHSPDWSVNLQSLIKTRRPSFAPTLPEYFRQARKPRVEEAEEPRPGPEIVQPVDTYGLPESPGEGKNLRSSLEINVKDLVGDAVGNMSISPASRDIVLAARRGLFIIDLESPFSIPRFLPQGGTWDVADVQWNPHHSHAQYIVSTSSERLLIWNLLMSGKTSIEHILLSHYRAITDINWHTTECDVVVSTGIDSWLWAWDLREPRKPIFGLSAFKAGGTQVKWNRKDGNILASSHSNEVLIWDRRKGSLPVTQIPAHSSKIYGIDWSRSCRNEIVTCSLDMSIKTWDINAPDLQGNPKPKAKATIQTNYPVWRARNLPFGEGILSLPQRGETTLEMYAKGEPQELIETFEGHSDVVKEFVWREGAQDAFQLITWSKDRTLRFWPIDFEVMQKAGHLPQIIRGRSKLTRTEIESKDTFRHPPESNGVKKEHPALSAPIGNRGILAEVRATHPVQPLLYPNPTFSNASSQASDDPFAQGSALTATSNNSTSLSVAANGLSTGGTMSKGGAGTNSTAQVDPLAWIASVRVSGQRGSSSGGGSRGGGGSGEPSRLGSRSRPESVPDRGVSEIGSKESGSSSRDGVERKEVDGSQSLQDEITSALTKLAASKIKLEKHDLKKRTCTLGLHGPWGETSHVFMRLTFTFPRDYPQAAPPHGIPTIELDRNPLIPVRTRAYILKHLRRIRQSKRPCLEACLRFLLFAYENQNDNDLMDSESSSDEEQPNGKKAKQATASLLRSHKNLAEPVSSQGAFGPNGEFVTFFRAPPRIVNNVLRNLTRAAGPRRPIKETPPVVQEPLPPTPPPPQPQTPQQPKKSYLQSPALVSDAVRRLGLAATDRYVQPIDPRRPEAGANIIRAMTNLFIVPQHTRRRDSMSQQHTDGEGSKNYALLAPKRSNVFFTVTADIGGADRKVALGYVFMADTLAEVCDKNAEMARNFGRYDHERVFKTLKTLFPEPEDAKKKGRRSSFTSDTLAAQVITRLYADIAVEKDVQMLAMIAVLVLQTEHVSVLAPSLSRKKESTPIIPTISHRIGGTDYFSLMKSTNVPSPISPAWPRQPSPTIPALVSSLSSSNSSRGSWSSLFNTGSMQRFMNGVQDTFKEGLGTPGEIPSSAREIQGALSRSVERLSRNQDSHSPAPGQRRRRVRKDSALYSPANVSRSWNEGLVHPSKALSPSFSSTSYKRPPLRFVRSNAAFIHEKQMVIFEPPLHEEPTPPVFTPQLIEQLKLNVYHYAELLFRWQIYHKRLELLKAVTRRDGPLVPIRTEVNRIGLHRICPRADCKMLLPERVHICPYCNAPCSMPACTVCRLPVKGLSRTCLSCSHVTHIPCWNSLDWSTPICPLGCGCFCTGTAESLTRPSTRLGLTPPPTTLLFASELP